jgi:AAA ATPase domain
MLPAYLHVERCASTARTHHGCICAAQQVCQLGGVRNRMIAEAVVYVRSGAALSRESAGQRRAFGEIYQDINRDQRRGAGRPSVLTRRCGRSARRSTSQVGLTGRCRRFGRLKHIHQVATRDKRRGLRAVTDLDSGFGPAQTFRMADAGDASSPASAGLVAAGTSESVRPFVGRLRELTELSAVLVGSSAGRGGLFMVTGEPGIGKSRLMEEFAGLLADQGWRVLAGRCWEHGGAPAYWPWIQVVRAAGGEFEDCMPAAAGTGGRPGASEPLPAPTSADPESDRFRLFDGVARFLMKVADDRRLLVVLDDLHAADEPSLLLLRFLAQTIAGERIVLLGAYREAEQRVHELVELFAELARVGHRIPLRGLSRPEVGSYISRVAARPAPEAVVAKVHDVTAGNPFFVGEVVRVLLADGSLADAGQPMVDPVLRIPEEVHALIRRRVAGLEREATANLRVAAVIGREFQLGVLQRVSRLSVRRLADALSEAVRAGILAEDPSVPGRYAFTHDLVRETLYQGMPMVSSAARSCSGNLANRARSACCCTAAIRSWAAGSGRAGVMVWPPARRRPGRACRSAACRSTGSCRAR